MSTTIAIIKGDVEKIADSVQRTVKHEPTSMHVTSFSGGTKRGAMIQLGLTNGNGHIQLPGAEVEILRDALTKWLEKGT